MDDGGFYPRISQAIWLLLLLLLLLAGIGAIVEILGFFQEESVFVSIVNTISFGIVLLWGSRKARAPYKEVFPMRRFPIRLLIPMCLVIIGISIVGSEVDNAFRAVLPPPSWLDNIFLRLAGHGTNPLGSILALVVVAPMTEELLFRGLILRGFLSHYRVRTALLTSAFLFGLFHLNPWQFVHTTAIGLLFAWWFLRTRSLIPCIFGHVLNNGQVFILRDVFGLDISGYTVAMGGEVQFQPLWLDAVGAVLLVFGIWLIVRLFRQRAYVRLQEPSGEESPTSLH
jgi:membrane protease YdiL (CAAX protease family)